MRTRARYYCILYCSPVQYCTQYSTYLDRARNDDDDRKISSDDRRYESDDVDLDRYTVRLAVVSNFTVNILNLSAVRTGSPPLD